MLAFDLMRGGDVMGLLLKRGSLPEDCALPETEAKILFLQVLSGLEFVHKNLIIQNE